jgi:5'-methylthioadenosine phosphorylase
MQADVAIIGGTGIGERLAALGGEVLEVPTPFGPASGRIIEMDGLWAFLVSRHAAGHKVPPHKVNYRAMALAVKCLGCKGCIGSAAVGSLREDWGPGMFVICHDFLDLSGRNITLFDDRVVHTDFSKPFSPEGRLALIEAAGREGAAAHDGGIYVQGNGPRFETPFEIDLYQRLGGDVVGMTAASEAVCMREAGVPYACLAVVTNLACGIVNAPLSHEEVVEEMERSGKKAVEIMRRAAASWVGAA